MDGEMHFLIGLEGWDGMEKGGKGSEYPHRKRFRKQKKVWEQCRWTFKLCQAFCLIFVECRSTEMYGCSFVEESAHLIPIQTPRHHSRSKK